MERYSFPKNIETPKNKNKSSYFRVKLKRIKFELYTEPDLDLN